MGGLTPKRRRSKKERRKQRLKGQASERGWIESRNGEERIAERKREKERDRREEEGRREKEREERELAWVPCALVERIHTVVRFGEKVFGQVQGDAAAAPFLFLSSFHSPLSLSLSLSFVRSFAH